MWTEANGLVTTESSPIVAGVMALIGIAFDVLPIAQKLIAPKADQIVTVRIVLGQTGDAAASLGGSTIGYVWATHRLCPWFQRD
jgi:hypothetical protein